MWIATSAWLSLVLAYQFRKQKYLHIAFAIAGIACDISLVVYLQLTRSALQTAMSFSLSYLEQTHIAVSTIALCLYGPTAIFGVLLATGHASSLKKTYHRCLAISALGFRTLGFIFMFSMLKT